MAQDRERDYEIAVVGDSGSIAGFAGLGLRTFRSPWTRMLTACYANWWDPEVPPGNLPSSI